MSLLVNNYLVSPSTFWTGSCFLPTLTLSLPLPPSLYLSYLQKSPLSLCLLSLSALSLPSVSISPPPLPPSLSLFLFYLYFGPIFLEPWRAPCINFLKPLPYVTCSFYSTQTTSGTLCTLYLILLCTVLWLHDSPELFSLIQKWVDGRTSSVESNRAMGSSESESESEFKSLKHNCL